MGTLVVISIVLGFVTTLWMIPRLLRVCVARPWLQRSTDCHHGQQEAIPRWGGLALVVAFIVVETFVSLFAPEERAHTPGRNIVLAGALAMFGVGFCDDLRPLGAKRKLLGQIVIAAVVCWCGIKIEFVSIPFGIGSFPLGGWAILVTIFWLVGMTNLINLIDGMDGLAGGICLMLMVLIAVVGHHCGNFELLACGMAGALAGFLRFNFPPARIYLGDGGAYFLGSQIGLFSIVNSHKGAIFASLVAPLFVLALPIVDAALAVLRRGLRGLPIFRPDRKHIHHRLSSMGFSGRQVVVWIHALTLGFLLVGLAAVWSPGDWLPVMVGTVTIILLICAGVFPFSRRWFAVGQVLANSLGMRRQTQYALCLKQWLELEGGRHKALENLWSDFVFAARRLGFVAVRLRLNEAERAWQQPGNFGPMRLARYEMQNGRFGILEFQVPVCPKEFSRRENTCDPNSKCELLSKCCPSDPRVFETMSELLAESWTKAAVRWRKCNKVPFKLDGSEASRQTVDCVEAGGEECIGKGETG